MQKEHHVTGLEAKLAVTADPKHRFELRTNGKNGIVLIPKPCDDPRDPLVNYEDHYKTVKRTRQLQPRSRFVN